MSKYIIYKVAAVAGVMLLAGVVGCSDDTSSRDASMLDKAVTDSKAKIDVTGAADKTVVSDGKTNPDGKVNLDAKAPLDLPAKPDVNPPKDTSPPADQAVVDAWAGACVGVTCTIQDNCCDCKARKGGTTVPVCPITTCKQNTCGAVQIKKATPYCLKGRCLLYDAGTACTTDTDCQKVDNCCDCLALPKGSGPPPCALTNCFVNTCTGWGLTAAKALCDSGVCKLKLP